jgi:hypothetical protein
MHGRVLRERGRVLEGRAQGRDDKSLTTFSPQLRRPTLCSAHRTRFFSVPGKDWRDPGKPFRAQESS